MKLMYLRKTRLSFFEKSSYTAESKSQERSSFGSVKEIISRLSEADDSDIDRIVVDAYQYMAKEELFFDYESEDNLTDEIYEFFRHQYESDQKSSPEAPPNKGLRKEEFIPVIIAVTAILDFLTSLLGFLIVIPSFIEALPAILTIF